MEKIMFNETYGLQRAVIDRRKTKTRRIVPEREIEAYQVRVDDFLSIGFGDLPVEVQSFEDAMISKARYKVGEIVAIAQNYKDAGWDADILQEAYIKKPTIFPDLDECEMSGIIDLPLKYHKGWSNKMFVRADLMPHQICITDVNVERLQDISDVDCFKEGIDYVGGYSDSYYFGYGVNNIGLGNSPREAFAALIDKISGKGTWDANPWVYVYEFELIK